MWLGFLIVGPNLYLRFDGRWSSLHGAACGGDSEVNRLFIYGSRYDDDDDGSRDGRQSTGAVFWLAISVIEEEG